MLLRISDNFIGYTFLGQELGPSSSIVDSFNQVTVARLMKVYGEFRIDCENITVLLHVAILENMGKQFGNLAKINGIVYFRLSPHEQKVFKGVISEGVPNTIRRFQDQVFRVAPFFMFTYLLINWAKEKNHALSRKNPKDYENDT